MIESASRPKNENGPIFEALIHCFLVRRYSAGGNNDSERVAEGISKDRRVG